VDEREYHDHLYARDAARIFESRIFGRVHERVARIFLRATGAGPKHRVLSLGCGDGSLECRIAPHVGEIVGVDISTVAIERARDKSCAAGLNNAIFLVCDSSAASFPDLGAFDVVATFAFLHHLDDARILEVLHSARSVLRSGGAFYSTEPSRRRMVRHFAGFVRRSYDRYHSPEERELDPGKLASWVAEVGLSHPMLEYTDYFLGPVAWLAPGTPRWLAAALEAIDNLALRLPIIRRYASSFSLLARVP
jgi:SAM-dependent methyltransferase